MSKSSRSNFSEAILRVQKLERMFLDNQSVIAKRHEHQIRSKSDRCMETFLQSARRQHDKWHRDDNDFRQTVKREKDGYEKLRERLRKSTDDVDPGDSTLSSLNTDEEPLTDVNRRSVKTLQASQKLLEECAARSKVDRVENDPSSTPNHWTSSYAYQRATLLLPMITSIDDDEFRGLIQDSLKRGTFNDIVDHHVKFCPEFREKYALRQKEDQRDGAMEKLRDFNQSFAQTQDERYHKLLRCLIDFRSEQEAHEKSMRSNSLQ